MMTNNSTIRYFIEIIPTGYYFFGNERTFMTTQKDKYEEIITNYYAESNILPQQTAVLGMLRHALLALYDRLDADQGQKNEIVGSENFGLNKDSPYGLIDTISPMVIFNPKDKGVLLPSGFDHQKYNNQDVQFSFSKGAVCSYSNGNNNFVPDLSDYKFKENINLLWVDHFGRQYSESCIFKRITKVGVDKQKSDDAFFKQTFIGLKEGWSLGVWVDFLDTIDKIKLIDILIPFGADQGLFKLSFRTDIEYPFNHVNNSDGYSKIIFLSDAWVDKGNLEGIDFGITQYTDFRYVNSSKKDFYVFREEDKDRKSQKYSLLKRGTVLFPDPGFDINVLNKPALKRIGYNYFKTI